MKTVRRNIRKSCGGVSPVRRKTVKTFSHLASMRWVRRLVIICLAAAGIGACIKHLLPAVEEQLSRGRLSRIREIRVAGCFRSDSAALIRSFPLKAGDPIFGADSVIQKWSRPHQVWIKSVSVDRSLLGKITLRVTERRPFALVNAGKVFVVDDEGILLTSASGQYENLPLLSPLLSDSSAFGACWSRFFRLSRSLVKQMPGFFDGVSEIQETVRGESLVYFMREPVRLRINTDDLTDQIRRYRRMRETAYISVPEQGVEFDLRFRNLVFVRKIS